MKKIKSFKSNEPVITEKDFVSTLQDGTTSTFKLLIDSDEWVLQGEDIQRICESELTAILKEVQKLNQKSSIKKSK
jgi:hypothetical protein